MASDFAARRGTIRSLAAVGEALATTAALAIGAALALFFAATVVVMALLSSALLALFGLANRARRTVRARRDDGVIEARRVGGHHWVAYGWNEPR